MRGREVIRENRPPFYSKLICKEQVQRVYYIR
jgi:hypothetical protein